MQGCREKESRPGEKHEKKEDCTVLLGVPSEIMILYSKTKKDQMMKHPVQVWEESPLSR